MATDEAHGVAKGEGQGHKKLTPGDDVEDQNNETHDAASSPSLPRLRGLGGNGRRLSDHEQRQLKEHGNDKVEHLGGEFGAFKGLLLVLWECVSVIAVVVRS